MSRRILVVEDNIELGTLLNIHLTDAGYRVEVRHDGGGGLQAALSDAHEFIILDLMLPGIDGLEICRRVRAANRHIPILMLTSKSSEIDRVVGLEIGADDYLTKPFSIPELLARVKAIFRRLEAARAPVEQTPPALSVEDLVIDFARHGVTRGGENIELTAKEFELLAFLAARRGRVFTRSQLLDQVWGYAHAGYEHTVNSHINRLRAKIERDPERPVYILTVWGVGYKFADGGI